HGGVEPTALANRDLAHRPYDRPSADLERDRPDDVPPRPAARPRYGDDREIEPRSAESKSVAWAPYDRDFGGVPMPITRARHRDDAEHIEPDEGIRSAHRDDGGNGYPRRPMFRDEAASSLSHGPLRREAAEMEPAQRAWNDDRSIGAAEIRDPSRDDARRRAEELAERLSVATVEERCKPAVDQGFADVKDRLDALTQQLSQLADLNAAQAGEPRPEPRDDGSLAEVRGRLDAMTQQLSQLADLNAQAQAPRPEPRDDRSLAEVRGRLDAM